MQALAQAPQRCGLVNHGILKSAKFCPKNPKKWVSRVGMGWYDFLALSALKTTQNVADPKKFWSAEISGRFWAKSNFGPQKSKKIDFLKFDMALYPSQNSLEKKRLGRLEAYISALNCLNQKKQKGLFLVFQALENSKNCLKSSSEISTKK